MASSPVRGLVLATFVVCAALLGVAHGSRRNRPPLLRAESRIVGGTNVSEGEIPWQVSIQTALGTHLCGGSIVTENFIVTAAHCSSNAASTYRVVAGSLTPALNGSKHTVLNITKHDRFSASTYFNDIAVWQVDPPFTWDHVTRPVNLPPKSTVELPPGLMATVSGWGATSFGGRPSDVLLKVEVPIVDKETCDEYYENLGGIFPSQICAGYAQGGKDQCQGDSGGPLFSEEGLLLGIVSWGNGCAFPRFPGVYTEVSAFLDWIEDNTDLGQSNTTTSTTGHWSTTIGTTEQPSSTIDTTEDPSTTDNYQSSTTEQFNTTTEQINTTVSYQSSTTEEPSTTEEWSTTIGTTEQLDTTTTIGTTEQLDTTTTIGTTEQLDTTTIGTTEQLDTTTIIGTTGQLDTTTIGTTGQRSSTIDTTEQLDTTIIRTTEQSSTTIGSQPTTSSGPHPTTLLTPH